MSPKLLKPTKRVSNKQAEPSATPEAKAKAKAKAEPKPKAKPKPASASSSKAAVAAVEEPEVEHVETSGLPTSRMINFLKYQMDPTKNKRGSTEAKEMASSALEASICQSNI